MHLQFQLHSPPPIHPFTHTQPPLFVQLGLNYIGHAVAVSAAPLLRSRASLLGHALEILGVPPTAPNTVRSWALLLCHTLTISVAVPPPFQLD